MVRTWLVAAALIAATSQPGPAQAFKRLEVGQPMADHTLETPGGETRQLAHTLGAEATAIAFWASWSPRSRTALEALRDLSTVHGESRLAVVAVNVDGPGHGPEMAEAIDTIRAELGTSVTQLVDTDLALFDSCGVVAVPSLVLLDGAGRVAALVSGYSSGAREEFAEHARRVLGMAEPGATVISRAEPDYQPSGPARTHYRMAQLYLSKHRTQPALELLAKALSEDPLNAEARATLATTLRSVGRADEAARLELFHTESEEYCLIPRRAQAAGRWQ